MPNRTFAFVVAFPFAALSIAACDSSGDPPPVPLTPPSVSPPISRLAMVPGPPVFDCGPGLPAVALQLPCEIGLPIGARVSVVECPVAGQPAEHKLSFVLDLDGAARMRNDVGPLPVLPFRVPQVHTLTGNGQTFTLTTVRGTGSFSSVDVDRRALLGRFVEAEMVFTAAGPDEIVCKSRDSLFWATPGVFR
jgi:hypothetical protein